MANRTRHAEATGLAKRWAAYAGYAAAGKYEWWRETNTAKPQLERSQPCYDPIRNPRRYYTIDREGLVRRAAAVGRILHKVGYDAATAWWRELAPLTKVERAEARKAATSLLGT